MDWMASLLLTVVCVLRAPARKISPSLLVKRVKVAKKWESVCPQNLSGFRTSFLLFFFLMEKVSKVCQHDFSLPHFDVPKGFQNVEVR